MALWGAEVKPGQEYVHAFSQANGRLRITRATLGSQHNLGCSNLEARVSDGRRARLCTLHPLGEPMCSLQIELEEDKDIIFSVDGQNSIYLSGYYLHAKAVTCSAGKRPTLSKGIHQEMSNSGNIKKTRREEGKTFHDSDHHGSIDQERNDGNRKTNDTPCSQFGTKNKVTVVKNPSGTATRNVHHIISATDIHEISDDEKETTFKAEEDAQLKVVTIIKGCPGAKMATVGSKVSVKFLGRLSNGEVFDEGESYRFRLGAGKAMHGWDLGITGMLVGEERILTIPPSQGYGDVKQDKIPPNSWLIYTITLLEVEQAKRTR